MSDETWAVLDDGWVAAQGSNEYDAIFRCIDERNATLAVKILNIKDARLAAALAVEPRTVETKPVQRHTFTGAGSNSSTNLSAPVEPQGPTSDNGKGDAPWWPVPPETCGQCGSGEFRETHSETRDADLEEGSVLVEFTCQGCGYIVSKYGHVPEGPTSEEGEPK